MRCNASTDNSLLNYLAQQVQISVKGQLLQRELIIQSTVFIKPKLLMNNTK